MKKRILAVLIIAVSFLIFANASAAITYGNNTGFAQIVGGWLVMRSGPGYTYNTIASYSEGSVVTVLDIQGDWVKAQAEDGTVGFMYSKFLVPSKLNSATINTNKPGTTAYVYSANGKPVRLRSGPSYSFSVITKLNYGTKITVINYGKSWHQVSVNGITGYMKNDFIVKNKPLPYVESNNSNTNSMYDAFIISKNGKGVRLRNAPGLEGSILGLYSVGTQIRVIKHEIVKGWDQIQVGNRIGFMMNRFITKNRVEPAPLTPPANNNNVYIQNITEVYLNTESANVGDWVYVRGVIPSDADVSYLWKFNNQIISYNSHVQIAPYMANGVLSVTVSGKGIYSGSIVKTVNINSNNQAQNNKPINSTGDLSIKLDKDAYKLNEFIIPSLSGLFKEVTYTWHRQGVQVSNDFAYIVQEADVNIGEIDLFAHITDTTGYSYVVSRTIKIIR